MLSDMFSPLPVALLTNADNEHGRRIVLDLLDAGYRVVLTGRHATRLARQLHGLDDRVTAIAAEVDDPWQAQLLRNRVVERFGRLDEIIDASPGRAAA